MGQGRGRACASEEDHGHLSEWIVAGFAVVGQRTHGLFQISENIENYLQR